MAEGYSEEIKEPMNLSLMQLKIGETRQTDRQSDRQTDNQTDNQTDRQTGKQRVECSISTLSSLTDPFPVLSLHISVEYSKSVTVSIAKYFQVEGSTKA